MNINLADTKNSFIYFASCAVNNTVPDSDVINNSDLMQVYSLASRHMMGAIVSMSLESAGYKDNVSRKFIIRAVRKTKLMDADMQAVLKALEYAEIWYMPLKGSVMKDYYPNFGMREMSDRDILVDSTRVWDIKRIMESLGFSTERFGEGNHDVYYKKPLSNFEIHITLFGNSYDERIYTYYIDVKDRLIKDEGNNYGYHFSLEDFYVYMTAHEYKHYSGKGTGLRSLLDVYVFLKKFEGILNFDYILCEVKKLGISEFELNNRTLALNLFGNNELTDENREMLEYIMNSGAYGTLENSVKNQLNKYGGGTPGKIKYLLTKIFPPVKNMKNTYPFFCEHKVFYPFLIIYRLLKALTIKRQQALLVLKILWRTK